MSLEIREGTGETTKLSGGISQFDASHPAATPCGECGPAWIRTRDQGIHVIEAFPLRVDYLFTRGS